ncbi:MAG TPA: DNA polymerase III subunit gamma/tau [Candidatus Babeliales bacterium]|nr:DNA polymerase III subunit gamma/tau [Candidatus Babeliales bacterium]
MKQNMNRPHVNLARSWRSKNFDQIVGQPLAVSILKNTLFVNNFFPVYLFAGQRGCGKTTTARVFAAAANCQKLAEFQKDPKKTLVPCQECESCIAMLEQRHPDFIEIDAASHTGVDNVRTIIDAATFLPVLGSKRIYLIDEAHMLSKAAFNAFLKILEEPPASVFFMLATTDLHKIIETVRSRCFQLFFNAVDRQLLCEHLEHMCKSENIEYELDGLICIARESQGLIRDAINILEQVRFAAPIVSKEHVYSVLGFINDEHLEIIITHVCKGDVSRLLSFLQEINIEQYDAQYIWDLLFDIIRLGVRVSFGVPVSDDRVVLIEKAAKASLSTDMVKRFEIMVSCQNMFIKSSQKHAILEMVLIRMCQGIPLVEIAPTATPQSLIEKSSNLEMVSMRSKQPQATILEEKKTNSKDLSFSDNNINKQVHSGELEPDYCWTGFLAALSLESDQLLVSLFGQSQAKYDSAQAIISIVFPEQLIFFKDLIDQHMSLIQRLLIQSYKIESLKVIYNFTKDNQSTSGSGKTMQSNVHKNNSELVSHENIHIKEQKFIERTQNSVSVMKALDISDQQRWEFTHLVLKYFDGKISEVPQEVSQEVKDEQFA